MSVVGAIDTRKQAALKDLYVNLKRVLQEGGATSEEFDALNWVTSAQAALGIQQADVNKVAEKAVAWFEGYNRL